MPNQLIVAGLDLGANAIKCVIGILHDDAQVEIIGTGSHPAHGFDNGSVSDQEAAVQSIRASVNEAELMAGCEIKEVLLSISNRHMESFNSHGMARVMGPTVDIEDVHAAIDMARAVKLPAEKKVLHVVPQDYIIDGRNGITRPLGVAGVRLETHAHVVLGTLPRLEALELCCQRAKLNVIDVVLSPLAQAEVLLTTQARDMGVILVDIGADTTDLSVFEGGSVVHSGGIALGGDHITQDVKDCLNTPTVEAEHLKQVHGCALADMVSAEETISVPGVGGRRARTIKRRYLCEIIEARAEEIMGLLAEELEQLGFTGGFPGGLVLTGGSANLAGIVDLAEQMLGVPAARGEPKGLHGLVDVVKNPRYSTAAGLVVCGSQFKHLQWFSTRQLRLKQRGSRRIFRFWNRT